VERFVEERPLAEKSSCCSRSFPLCPHFAPGRFSDRDVRFDDDAFPAERDENMDCGGLRGFVGLRRIRIISLYSEDTAAPQYLGFLIFLRRRMVWTR
jgi:hypothetical protein